MRTSSRTLGRFVVVVLAMLAVAACAAPKRAKYAPPASRATESDSGPPPQVSACREYADDMAGRQLQRDYDSIDGNFQGGSSQVFRDFAHMDAKRYYRQLYESCLSEHRARGGDAVNR